MTDNNKRYIYTPRINHCRLILPDTFILEFDHVLTESRNAVKDDNYMTKLNGYYLSFSLSLCLSLSLPLSLALSLLCMQFHTINMVFQMQS